MSEEKSSAKGGDNLSRLFASYVNDFKPPKEIMEIKTGTSIDSAITMLIEGHVRSAPVFDERTGKYVGWLDTRDLVALVVQAYHSDVDAAGYTDLKSMLMRSRAVDQSPVEAVVDLSKNNPFVPVYLGQLMVDALVLLAEGVHRVPVLDPATNRIAKIISQSDILNFLSTHMDLAGPVADQTLEELGLARRGSIVAVQASASPLRAFELMAEHKLSGLPIVEDGTGNLLTVVSATDVNFLIKSRRFDYLARHGRGRGRGGRAGSHGGEGHTVMDFISDVRLARTSDFVAAASCSPQWSLRKVASKLVATRVHRLYVVEPSGRRLIGVVAIRDILNAVARASATGGDATGAGAGTGATVDAEAT